MGNLKVERKKKRDANDFGCGGSQHRINGTELVELVLKYYSQLSEKYQKMIPLKMVYIPVTLDPDSK